MKVRKKPVEVDAVQFVGVNTDPSDGYPLPRFHDIEPMPEWLYAAISDGAVCVAGAFTDKIAVLTMEGTMEAPPGSWIIRGVKGELYPCADDIFRATYDLPPEPAP